MINRIKRHRKRGHGSSNGGGAMHMTLVPFIDMLTILVVFLLVHTSDVDVLPNTKNISIPESISDKKPRPTVVVRKSCWSTAARSARWRRSRLRRTRCSRR